MAQQPHDKSGTKCKCGHIFTKQSFSGTIKFRSSDGLIEAQKVCLVCLNQHYSKGEQ